MTIEISHLPPLPPGRSTLRCLRRPSNSGISSNFALIRFPAASSIFYQVPTFRHLWQPPNTLRYAPPPAHSFVTVKWRGRGSYFIFRIGVIAQVLNFTLFCRRVRKFKVNRRRDSVSLFVLITADSGNTRFLSNITHVERQADFWH